MILGLICWNPLMAKEKEASVIIDNPKYDASTWYQIQLQSIELSDIETVLTIQMRKDYTFLSRPMKKVCSSSGCGLGASSIYIENETGTQRMYMTKVKSEVVSEDKGIKIARFKVSFPALPKAWKGISYIEPFHQIGGIRINDQELNIEPNVHLTGKLIDIHPCMKRNIYLERKVTVIDEKGKTSRETIGYLVNINHRGEFKTAFNVDETDEVYVRYMMYRKNIKVKPGSAIQYFLPLGEKVDKPESLEILKTSGTRESVVDLSSM